MLSFRGQPTANRKILSGKQSSSSPTNCGIKCTIQIIFGILLLFSCSAILLNLIIIDSFFRSQGDSSRGGQQKQQHLKQKDPVPEDSENHDKPFCDVVNINDAIQLVRKKVHIVQPPPSPITLVCCQTTKGPLSIAVHPNWAPRGADRFLSMVNTWYFSSKVPMFRCLNNFLCQFGIAGDPSLNKQYGSTLLDDPNWLPEGPDGRKIDGKFRYSKGYVAYAGGGPNSRSNQLIVALDENKFLGGGSPWEVPFGEVIGDLSMKTLDELYTGYDEKGPTQGMVYKQGASEAIAIEFPKLDYVLSCSVIEESSSW